VRFKGAFSCISKPSFTIDQEEAGCAPTARDRIGFSHFFDGRYWYRSIRTVSVVAKLQSDILILIHMGRIFLVRRHPTTRQHQGVAISLWVATILRSEKTTHRGFLIGRGRKGALRMKLRAARTYEVKIAHSSPDPLTSACIGHRCGKSRHQPLMNIFSLMTGREWMKIPSMIGNSSER
jgi:hypothetical protein